MDEWKLPPFWLETVFTPLSQLVDWGVRDLGIPDLWAEFGQGEGVKVCILDTGQPNHTDLIEGLSIAKDFTSSARGVKDYQGHGTHCAGIVGARNNDKGTIGVAPRCEILCGKVLGDNGSGSANGIAAGIDWAISQGADVISMSLGSSQPSQVMLSAINRIPPSIILTCAAGNAGPGESMDYPGAWPRSLSVASTNQNRNVSQFSTRNAEVDIAAPGERITSCWLSDQTATLSGTSMATPFIAGIGAMAKGYGRARGFATLTHGFFASLLQETADDIGPPGPDTASGAGIINPKRFFERLRALSPPMPTPPIPEKTVLTVAGKPLAVGTYQL